MEAALQVRNALLKVQTEYIEIPQLKLTAPQVQRLWSLPKDVCEAVLAALIQRGFLVHSSDGAYMRSHARRTQVDRVEQLVRAS